MLQPEAKGNQAVIFLKMTLLMSSIYKNMKVSSTFM